MSELDRMQARREARKARRKVSRDQRRMIDRLICEVVPQANGDIELATNIVRFRFAEMGLDPATIILLIEIFVLIYKALVAFNVLAPTPQMIEAIFEDYSDA